MKDSIHNNSDDMKLQQLARMVKCRRSVSVPDVDASWETFRSKHIEASKQVRNNRIKMWISALSGAAAMLVGVVLYTSLVGSNEKYIVLQHEEKPQQITLTEDGMVSDVSGLDSISYVEEQAGNAEDTGKSIAYVGKSGVRRPGESATEARMQRLSTPRGMDFKVVLNDGTEVWLNAESTIEFPDAFMDGERRVNLTGEAYFKVARNVAKPFVVGLGDKSIHVLGTEFDVRNYASESSSVVLVKGSVQLCNAGGKEVAKLVPGQGAVWKDNNEVSVKEVDTYSAIQWLDGLFYFEESTLGEVLREVGRWYNYGVVFKDAKHIAYRIHFSASKNDELKEIIDDLNAVQLSLSCIYIPKIENTALPRYRVTAPFSSY